VDSNKKKVHHASVILC